MEEFKITLNLTFKEIITLSTALGLRLDSLQRSLESWRGLRDKDELKPNGELRHPYADSNVKCLERYVAIIEKIISVLEQL